MTRADDLRSLRDRVLAASGPDKKLDMQIYFTLFPTLEERNSGRNDAFTASLDAAVALCERVLPNWTAWELRSRRAKTQFTAEISRIQYDDGEQIVSGTAATPALALLAALLSALIEQEPADDRA